MKLSLTLGSFAGIRVYVHWTFSLLLGWILFAHLGRGHDWMEAWRGVGFILALFGCVLLHEFGHALTAKRYGIRTQDITLLPIGGIARLERLRENPRQELWVTLAGPAVNVVIAGVLFAILGFVSPLNEFLQVRLVGGTFLVQLMWVNVFLGAFNLLPAFPMDGGRVLRALLSMRLGRARATRLSLATQGRMLLLSQGYHQSNGWWRGRRWDQLRDQLPAGLVEPLETFRRVIVQVEGEVQVLSQRVAQAAPAHLPKGLGALTHEVLEGEMKDWNNFQNRRQVGSYSGLTGGVSGSGEQSADLSITKAGNRRLSTCLVESAWRMVLFQPNYWLVQKWRDVLLNPKAHVRRRKQGIVAFARQLLVDLWKWKTGRVTPAQLGWQMT